jgi:uncharacterized phage-associated protein
MKVVERKTATTPLTFAAYENDSDARLTEIILYIAQKCGDNARFGAIKLNKVLFYADFYAYAITGKPITGSEYRRLQLGPVPARLVPIRNAMVEKGDIRVVHDQHFGFRQTRIVPLRKPRLDIFSATEIEIVNDVIEHLWDQSAKQVSDESHLKPWQVAGHRGQIPYEAVFLSDEGPTQYDQIRAQELIREHRWSDV